VTCPCSVDSIVHHPVVEQDVRHLAVRSIFAQGSDGQSVARESTVTILSDDILCPVYDRNAIIAIIPVVSVYGDVLSTDVEAIGVLVWDQSPFYDGHGI
jgi:hypothetical protein